ncbi:MAG: sigma-54-dependent Fis family transcriptional regulator [Deltaproteobacteria bacterium]|nr:sigma-54-dependent Fis family transcriptional regulator [Deltaproteobacteria bacterium]
MVAAPENGHRQRIGVLIVGGDGAARAPLREFFTGRQIETWEAESAARGFALMHRRPVDLVVVGPDVLRDERATVIAGVRAFDDQIEVIAIVDSAERGRAALAAGAYDFFLEPVDFERFDVVLRHVGDAAETREQSSVLAQQVQRPARLGRLVSQSPGMIALFTAARRLARYETPVLIAGESGTGKESLARAIHELGREAGPFVVVEAATATSESFDRAAAKAAGGTLYVDDVLALAPQVSATLVALLDGGGARGRETSARVIAACREDAGRRCSQGTLQEDLYLRLSSAAFSVPPLRERAEDVLPIADEILHGLGAPNGTTLGCGVGEALARYEWRGNVDELRVTLEAARAAASGRAIELRDLPPAFRHGQPAVEESVSGESRHLSDIEAAHLRKALAETRGNKARAARLLGLSRWALQRKLQKHHISLREVLS